MSYYMIISNCDIKDNKIKNVIWVKSSCIDPVYRYMIEQGYDFIIPYGKRKPRKVDAEQIIELS